MRGLQDYFLKTRRLTETKIEVGTIPLRKRYKSAHKQFITVRRCLAYDKKYKIIFMRRLTIAKQDLPWIGRGVRIITNNVTSNLSTNHKSRLLKSFPAITV